MPPESKDVFGNPKRLKPGAAATVAAGGATLPPETPKSGSPETPATPPGVDLADLKRKSIRGGTVTMLSQGISIAIQLTSTVILARLLSPNDYGVIAMVMAVTALAGLFRDIGLSSAAIQKKDLTRAQQSNLFWLNVAMGTLLTILVGTASPLVAWFYDKPELLWVTVSLSSTFLIGSLGTQHGAMLVRNMQFGRKAVAGITGSLVMLATAFAFAINGYSYWSLVWGNIAGGFTTTVLLFALSPFRPGAMAKGTGIRDMLKFGANITAFDFVNYFHRNLDNLLIGRFWGTGTLGLYSRAYQLLMFPINAIRGPINAVAFPAMSRLQHEPSAYQIYYRRITGLLALLSMPLVAFLFLASRPLIEIALGTSWLGVAPIFSILAITAFIQPVASLRGIVLLSTGQGKRYLQWGIFNAVAVCIGFGIGIAWGAIGIAVSYAVVNYAILYPSLVLAFKHTPLEPRDFFEPVALPAVASFIAAAVCHFAVLTPLGVARHAPWLLLGLLGLLFCSTCLLVLWIVPSGRKDLLRLPLLISQLRGRPA